MVIKTTDEGVAKDPGTSGSAPNLKIVTFKRRDDEKEDRKYDIYATRKEERNLRMKALERHVFRILEGRSLKPRVSALIIFTDEDLAIVKVPHTDPLLIKLRIRYAIVSRVLVDGGSSSDVIF